MKRIGLIDFYISEWHANNYPAWIAQMNETLGTDYVVSYAWAEQDISPVDGVDTATWCQNNHIEQCASIDEVCEKSDFLIILAPSDPQKHLGYAQAVLPHGKPTYIDKTFAPSAAVAQEILDLSEKYHTPFFSTSALRYATELEKFTDVRHLAVSGSGSNLPEYIIHLVEMVICLQKSAAKEVTVIRQGDQRFCHVTHGNGNCTTLIYSPAAPYTVMAESGSGVHMHETIKSAFFDGLMADILRFFESGEIPVPNADTMAVMHLRDAILAADALPGTKVSL